MPTAKNLKPGSLMRVGRGGTSTRVENGRATTVSTEQTVEVLSNEPFGRDRRVGVRYQNGRTDSMYLSPNQKVQTSRTAIAAGRPVNDMDRVRAGVARATRGASPASGSSTGNS